LTDSKTPTARDLIGGIRSDLGLEGQALDESYVALPKQYTLNTELLSPKTKHSHVELYESYIKALNRISAKLDTVDRQSVQDGTSAYRALKSGEVFNMNAVHLHELYFANVSDVHSQIDMDTLVYMRLERDFGTFEDWQFDIIACALSSQTGWAVTAYSTFLQRYINFFVDGHDACIPVGCYPVIVIDVWEHSYYRDYLTDRKSYVYAMMKELRWDIIEERFKRADKIGLALR